MGGREVKYFDPLKLSREVEKVVLRRRYERRYYRFRGGRWYGGIATADTVGCNLRCRFCWSWKPRDHMVKYGRYYGAKDVFERLTAIASKRGYRALRISGGEPTIGKDHLISLLGFVATTRYVFILETNGILIGQDRSYAKELARFNNLHVRVSIKGTSPEEFAKLTGAEPKAFEYQLKALANLLDEGVPTHPAVMLSFSEPAGVKELISKLREIDERLVKELEPEYVFLYPHVVKLMNKYGLKPRVAYDPRGIPKDLV